MITSTRPRPAGHSIFAAALEPATPRPHSFLEEVGGLPVELQVRGPAADGPAVEAAAIALYGALRADDTRFSLLDAGSQVSRIRRGELRLADAEPRVRDVAATCLEAEMRTAGAFSAWRTGTGEAAERVVARFDPSRLAQAWAVQDAFDTLLTRLRPLGGYDVLLSAGDDVIAACARTDTPDWTVAVHDPRRRGRVLRSLRLRTGAVATARARRSGTTAAQDAADSALLAATVIGPDLTWAAVHADAALTRGRSAVAALHDLVGYSAVLVTRESD
jgi:thiamine biosynthesis lipoprotein